MIPRRVLIDFYIKHFSHGHPIGSPRADKLNGPTNGDAGARCRFRCNPLLAVGPRGAGPTITWCFSQSRVFLRFQICWEIVLVLVPSRRSSLSLSLSLFIPALSRAKRFRRNTYVHGFGAQKPPSSDAPCVLPYTDPHDRPQTIDTAQDVFEYHHVYSRNVYCRVYIIRGVRPTNPVAFIRLYTHDAAP